MLQRCAIAFALLIATSTPLWGADLYPLPDQHIALAAVQSRQKNYREARKSALKAPQGGIRDFMIGITASKLEDWTQAAPHLARAAESFPLLADYALYNEARALYRLARFGEALPPLQRLLKEFPASPLSRQAQLLYADTLFEMKDFANAYSSYQKFIERFASGSDSLSATYKSGSCLEELGDAAGAVAAFKSIWVKYPSSTFASKAENHLQQLAAKGNKVVPYTAEELLRRATTLYDLKKYDEAVKAFRAVSLEGQSAGSADKYRLKTCLALFKARRYREAEAALSLLLQKKPTREAAEEAGYWLAKTLDKNGRQDEACTALLKLAETAASPELADKALVEAASIRKGQKKKGESLSLLKKLLVTHPASTLRQTVTWEIAWGSYLAGDMKAAADYLKPLTESASTRERALYWYGRTLGAMGDKAGASAAFSSLDAQFPFGFYSLTRHQKETPGKAEISLPTASLCESFPLPSGYERVKALITLGLRDEARKELVQAREKGPKGKLVPGIARLYLEMEDYNGAYHLLRDERPQKLDKDNRYQWQLCFPPAYRDNVAKAAAANDLPQSLVYSIIRAESSFSPTALSPVGAMGLMQLMPATAAAVSKSSGKIASDILTDPETNIRLGSKHLQDLLTLYNDDVVLAVAAYNAGAGNVNRWRKSFGALPKDEFVENIPFGETREYVKKVVASAAIYRRLYGFDSPVTASPVSPSLQPGTTEASPKEPSLPAVEAVTTPSPWLSLEPFALPLVPPIFN